ncbi:MAG: hypothetical protein ACREJC_03790 [Tepidisphaeraceae bacterium]
MENKTSTARAKPSKQKVVVPDPLDKSALMARFTEKEKVNFERQVAACEAKTPALAQRWAHLARYLAALATHPIKLMGMDTMMFFIPDGKYRKQVFALHALEDGTLAVYSPDVLDSAVSSKVLSRTKTSEGEPAFKVGDSEDLLMIESLDGKTLNPAPYFKDMTGWNRKAIAMGLPVGATPNLLKTVEYLCALAAMDWSEAKA